MNANSDLKYQFTNVNGIIIKKKSVKEDSFFYKLLLLHLWQSFILEWKRFTKGSNPVANLILFLAYVMLFLLNVVD